MKPTEGGSQFPENGMNATPRTDAATYPADCLGKTLVVHRDLAAALEVELKEAEQIDDAANHYLARAESAEARVKELVASKRTPSQLPEKGKWSKMDSEQMYARTEMSFTPRTDDVLDDNNYFAGSTFIALRKLCRQLEVELSYMTVRAELAEQELTELRAAQTKAPYTEPKAT
jgi:hypothetical protein